MKTKTDYFTKFITFCVLSLFLITNMILFTSCDNGNSPNDNTNEEQNNNAPTDYCKICDGVQDKDHQHDYCGECYGIQDKNHQHEQGGTENEDGTITETTYPDWFKEEYIGGEGSPYKIACIYDDIYTYLIPEGGSVDNIEMMNLYNDAYKKYIQEFTFTDSFVKKFGNINISFKKFDNQNTDELIHYNKNFDYLIGSRDDANGSINNICAPIFEEITKNIKISEDADIDKKLLMYYYNAMKNEAYYSSATSGNINNTDYNAKKTSIDTILQRFNTSKGTSFSIYEKTTDANGKIVYGEILPEVVDRLNLMFDHAADNLGIKRSDIQNLYNISLVSSSAEGLRDHLITDGIEYSNTKHTNEMSTVISEVDPIAKAPIKLNKSIFSHDYGRKLV